MSFDLSASADEADLRPDDAPLPSSSLTARVAVIRTSDRITFKRCRRRWGWSSHLRQNLGGKQAVSPLWVGSGFHFAMEDFHGKRIYSTAATAFDAYVMATRRKGGSDALPPNWKADHELAIGMLNYYQDEWLSHRDPLETFVYQSSPQVEVNFRIEIPFDALEWGYDQVVYSGTLDRISIDSDGLLWIVEYKTAKRIVTSHYQTDPQVTAYCWAASLLYPGYPIGGVIYQQHRKDLPMEARILSSGKLSTDTRQPTTYTAYRRAVLNLYGSIEKTPAEIVGTLNHYSREESPEANHFVRRDKLYRNAHQCEAEGQKILLEVGEMLNPDLALFPNPTRDCSWCGFIGPCVSMDDGGDWEQELEIFNQPREASYDSWRHYLPSPTEV